MAPGGLIEDTTFTDNPDPKKIEFKQPYPSVTFAIRAMLYAARLNHGSAELLRVYAPAARAERAGPFVKEHLLGTAKANADLHDHGRKVQANHDAFYQVPPANSSAEAIYDVDTLNRVRAMKPSELALLDERISRGEEPRVLLARLRSPFASERDPSTAKTLHAAWRNQVDRSHPTKAAQIKADRDHQQWAEAAIPVAARHAVAAALQHVSPAEIAKIVHGVPGGEVFGAQYAGQSAA